MARKDTIDINASGKKLTIKDVRATNMRNDPSGDKVKSPKAYAEEVVGMFADDEKASEKEYRAMDVYFVKNDPDYAKKAKAEQEKQIQDILKANESSAYAKSIKVTEAKVVTKKNNGGTL